MVKILAAFEIIKILCADKARKYNILYENSKKFLNVSKQFKHLIAGHNQNICNTLHTVIKIHTQKYTLHSVSR